MKKIPLFITLDAEGDNGWGRPDPITAENAKGVDRFQVFCEKYNMKPIYLATYEMAQDENFVTATKQKNHDGLCEVGMHMHGWNTPPIIPLTDDDLQHLPFIVEYPKEQIDEKVKNITKLLEDTFEENVVSHRSGRWIVDNDYLDVLVKYGYKIDCSVTPGLDWTCSIGDPNGNGGADYSKCSDTPHTINLPHGKILELPMSTTKVGLYDNFVVNTLLNLFPKSMQSSRIYNGLNARKTLMLRPSLRTKYRLMRFVKALKNRKDIEHVEFMIHTSEVYVGTCPHCHTEEELDALYDLMGEMFAALNEFCESMTFREYAKQNNL